LTFDPLFTPLFAASLFYLMATSLDTSRQQKSTAHFLPSSHDILLSENKAALLNDAARFSGPSTAPSQQLLYPAYQAHDHPRPSRYYHPASTDIPPSQSQDPVAMYQDPLSLYQKSIPLFCPLQWTYRCMSEKLSYITNKLLACFSSRIHAIYCAYPSLNAFIYGLHEKMQLSMEIIVIALYYILKIYFMPSRMAMLPGSLNIHPNKFNHGVVLGCLVLATKFLQDDTFSNDLWSQLTFGLFSTLELNRIERQLLRLLDFRLWPQDPFLLQSAYKFFCH
jgi:Cyclin, N-terminal domain